MTHAITPDVHFSSLGEPFIEVANQSGVSGYDIGIFGTNFGSTAGRVTILGTEAEVEEWLDTFVKVTIPAAEPGVGELRLTTTEGLSVTNLFQLYTISPIFQTPPPTTFHDVAQGKPAYLTNLTDTFCFRQPENVWTEPTEYLTNYRCGYSGITGDGHATLDASSTDGAIIAVDLEQTLTGHFYFQFWNSSGWYSGQSAVPQNYEVEVSVDSTDGLNGTWISVHSEVGNSRAFRLHEVVMPSGGAQWIRLRVTSSNLDNNTFIMKTIRLYQPSASNGIQSSSIQPKTTQLNTFQDKWDMFAVYGDSITKDANELIGPLGLAKQIQEISNGVEEPLVPVFGLSGQNSTGLVEQTEVDSDIYDAFAQDGSGSQALYWGIGLGTNDSQDSIDLSEETWSNIGAFDERMDAIVQEIIRREAAPILARLPDTDEAQGGFGTLASKKKLLADIDRLGAQYRLIPGPDFYTAFRYNIEFEESSWLRAGDGTHHTNEGRLEHVRLWAEAFVRGTNRADFVTAPTPTPTATQTNTPPPTNTPTETRTPIPSATPTSVTLLPSATHTATPTVIAMTSSPTATSPTAMASLTPIATLTVTPTGTSTAVVVPTALATPNSGNPLEENPPFSLFLPLVR
ncbi:MAG: hypothetical protein AAF702_15120 [Chloroflexota bacterium]